MALDRATFRARFPEFNTADDAYVDAKLAEALLQIDASVWGTKADLGQGYLAAHLLAVSPFGQQARLSSKEGETTYHKVWASLRNSVASGFRVI
ncbi:MAG: DUF4054 domain-containing protein [Polyangiaceae bacterium]|nr:DUF4054 domain-containing protein [Polyangiaceae bacterium]